MKQIQGLIAQYDTARKNAASVKIVYPQEDIRALSAKKRYPIWLEVKGSQHIANANTIAIDILSTFRSRLSLLFLELSDCSPGVFRDFSFKKMAM